MTNMFFQKGQAAVVLILCLTALTGVMLSGGANILWNNNSNENQSSDPLITPEPPVIGKPVSSASLPARNSLQLGEIKFEIITPAPPVPQEPVLPPAALGPLPLNPAPIPASSDLPPKTPGITPDNPSPPPDHNSPSPPPTQPPPADTPPPDPNPPQGPPTKAY